jgi:hypothetical protein
MAIAMCESISMIFFWYEESSSALRWVANPDVSFQIRWSFLGVSANLESNQHGMCLVHQSHHDGSLLHGFLCIFYLEDTALWGAVIARVSI